MGSVVPWILDGLDWVLYSVVDGAMNQLPCPGKAAGQDPGPVWLLFRDPDQAGRCTKFPEFLGLCSLFKCHCKQGCWMGCVASHVLSLGSLVRWAEGCLQQ